MTTSRPRDATCSTEPAQRRPARDPLHASSMGSARSSVLGDTRLSTATSTIPGRAVRLSTRIYGFVACVLLVLIAKEMRKIVMRNDDYYDD